MRAIPRPGGQHFMANGTIERDADVVIECARGIAFRLKLSDEQGKAVAGTVEYYTIDPNPHAEELIRPDGHVGLRADRNHVEGLAAYDALLRSGRS